MKFVLSIAILCSSLYVQSQTNLIDINPDKEFDNILVKKINTDSLTTSFVIWIKKEVKSHYHIHHTENLYVLEGQGELILNSISKKVKAGDFITIPKGVIHSFKTLSSTAVKVLSIQAPEFVGKDRVYSNQ